MRFEFRPTPEQRADLQARRARLERPEVALDVVRPVLPPGFDPAGVACAVCSVHPDRFVLRVAVHDSSGERRTYALKVYVDDFGRRVWAYARTLAPHAPGARGGRGGGGGGEGGGGGGGEVCLPIRHVPVERMLILPWVDGPLLSNIRDHRTAGLLRSAAHVAAQLHRTPVVPERPTTAEMMLEETRARCLRARLRWPATAAVFDPLLAALEQAAGGLDPAEPVPVHGDLWTGQFVWAGDRLVLLDLDMFGYADPAYDAGHFLAQLERQCLLEPGLPRHAREWLSVFRDAYLEAMPGVSPHNVAFYRGLTLVRKIHTVCRTVPRRWPRLVPELAIRARAALEDAALLGRYG